MIKKNDVVTVAGPEGTPLKNKDTDKWSVIEVSGNKVVATPVGGTDKEKKTFHCSRILECNGAKTDAIAIAEKQSSIQTKQESNKEDGLNVEQTDTQTPKLDISTLSKDGSELYSKKTSGFDHADYEVVSYCLIAPDKKSYKNFNLYNGSLGKDGGTIISKHKYDIKDKKNGYKKLINSLLKKNYTKIA